MKLVLSTHLYVGSCNPPWVARLAQWKLLPGEPSHWSGVFVLQINTTRLRCGSLQSLLAYAKPWGLIRGTAKTRYDGAPLQSQNLGGSGIQGHLWLPSEFKARLGYLRFCQQMDE